MADIDNDYNALVASLNNQAQARQAAPRAAAPVNHTSTLGAILRGGANALSLGLDDELLSGLSKATNGYVPDYGDSLRRDEATDQVDHPYARMAGQAGGAIAPMLIPGVGEANAGRLGTMAARAYMNPAVNGAITAIGNSNDLNKGDGVGALEQGLIGGASGAILGKVLQGIGNKMATGQFGKQAAPVGEFGAYGSEQPDIATWLSQHGVATPNQYVDNGVMRNTLDNYVQRSTAGTPEGQRANQELLAQVNRSFPFVTSGMAERGTIMPEIIDAVNARTRGSYNAADLKDELDRHINGYFQDAHAGAIDGSIQGMNDGGDAWNAGHELQNSPLYQMLSEAAPIHQAIRSNAYPAARPATANGNLPSHLMAALPAGLGLATGHGIGGILGTALLEGAPVVGRAAANRVGINDIQRAINDPIGVNPGIGEVRDVVGNFIQRGNGPVAGQVAGNVQNIGAPAQAPAYNRADKLRSLGFTDEQIRQLGN